MAITTSNSIKVNPGALVDRATEANVSLSFIAQNTIASIVGTNPWSKGKSALESCRARTASLQTYDLREVYTERGCLSRSGPSLQTV
jgi:hypothetical protein